MNSQIPTAVLLTPRGRGAVATVRYDGPCELLDARDDLFRAASGLPLHDQPLGRVIFGHWGSELTEDVVASRVAATAVEFHCHGGEAAARRLLDGLAAAGCQIVTWKEWLAATLGVLAAESAEALARTTTARTAALVLEQQKRLPDAILELVTLAERRSPELGGKLDALLRWANFGVHLTRPWSVVLAGRPNVGKSSLINALIGYVRSIVFDQPGTTRDVVTAETALDGWPIELADTAGVREDAEVLEATGIALARRRLADADCRVLLIDTSRPPHADDRALLAAWPGSLVVAHKCDLPDRWGHDIPAGVLRVSSVTGEGLAALAEAIVARLVPEPPPAGTAVPLCERQVSCLSEARAAATTGAYDVCLAALQECLHGPRIPAGQEEHDDRSYGE